MDPLLAIVGLGLMFLSGKGNKDAAKPAPAAPPEDIKDIQRRLGVTPDGIIGPKTRAAAEQQGMPLPTRAPATPKKPPTSKTPAPVAPTLDQLAQFAATLDLTPDDSDGAALKQGAQTEPPAAERQLVTDFSPATDPAAADPDDDEQPDGEAEPEGASPAQIKEIQKKLGVTPDGIIGPKTRAAAQKQGVKLPKPKPVPKKAAAKPKPPAAPTKPALSKKPAPAAPKPVAKKPAPKPVAKKPAPKPVAKKPVKAQLVRPAAPKRLPANNKK